MHDQRPISLAWDESSYTKHVKDKKVWPVHILSDAIPILKLCIEWRMKNNEWRMKKNEECRRKDEEWRMKVGLMWLRDLCDHCKFNYLIQ